MAAARKCDCCGCFYDAYNTKDNRFAPSGFIPLNVNEHGNYVSHRHVDCCENCMAPILDIMTKVKDRIVGKK